MNKNSTPWKNMNKTYFIARSGIFLNEYLSIKGAILGKQALEKYLQQSALDNQLTKKSSRETYPIPRLKENFDFISQTYDNTCVIRMAIRKSEAQQLRDRLAKLL